MIIKATLVMAGLGFSVSVLLALASRIFHVPEDPRLTAIKAALPGLNCGGCGYVGCEGAARAILQGKAPATICVGGGRDVAERLMAIIGEGKIGMEFPVAAVHCFGSRRLAPRFDYDGPSDCRLAAMFYGGANPCDIGCLGGGTCAAVCPFNAISPAADRLPRIDPMKCRGCGRCVAACPRGVIRLETTPERLLHLNTVSECLAPCRQRCPAQINVPRFIAHLVRGRRQEALQIIKERNPFPMTVGRTCTHPCENICRRNIADEAVAVGHLQRYLGDWERYSGNRIPIPCLPDTGHRVAVVGSGPAGLSCAYFLRRLGHRPTVLEARPRPGGMLRYGIPAYRLPKDVVDWEIQGILDLGIPMRTGVVLGRDFTLAGLRKEGYEAIFLGMGAWSVPQMCIPGEYAVGVHRSLDFLAGIGARFCDLRHQSVVVVGESNTAMDCARCSIRLGAETVTVLCSGERKEMSARKRDVTRALEEGVCIDFMTLPVRILTGVDGRVEQVLCQRLEPAPEGSDRPARPLPLPGSERCLAADVVIVAYERKPDLSYLLENEDQGVHFQATRAETLAARDVTLLAAAPDIFAGGDMRTGRATVIGAVAEGRMAARSIHHLITTGHLPPSEDVALKLNPRSILKNIHPPPGPARATIRELPVALRTRSFTEEVVGTISDLQAAEEAQRCMLCGSLCYRR